LFRSVYARRAQHAHHACMPNQIAAAIIEATITAQTIGVTFFELPLRGGSLAAWLNSVFMT
jgi:hypothetical protein